MEGSRLVGGGQCHLTPIPAVVTVGHLERQRTRFQPPLPEIPGGTFCEIFDHGIEGTGTADVLVEGGSTLDAAGNLATPDVSRILPSTAFMEKFSIASQQSRKYRACQLTQLLDGVDADVREGGTGARTNPGKILQRQLLQESFLLGGVEQAQSIRFVSLADEPGKHAVAGETCGDGEPGAGRTTFMRLIGQSLYPTEGFSTGTYKYKTPAISSNV